MKEESIKYLITSEEEFSKKNSQLIQNLETLNKII